ncbi:MAG: chromate efflux transporter [Pirellulales bacterium]
MTTDPTPSGPISWPEALRVWTRIALLSFGGPTGQIAVMHRILVEERRWISEERFLHALHFCMLLPGPEAQQLATYIGWLAHRTLGGLVAGTLFVLPGFLAILGLSIVYVEGQDWTLIQGLFLGLKPAVIALVAEAVLRMGRRALRRRVLVIVAALSFVAIGLCQIPFPWIILAAGVAGFLGAQWRPEWFTFRPTQHTLSTDSSGSSAAEPPERLAPSNLPRPSWNRAARISLLCLPLWFGPILALGSWQGSTSVYVQQGLFFSKAAVVTFGGAYSVLSYVAQEAVERHHWLESADMLAGLGLAESTPGPLIMVVQFVGFLGAYRQPGTLSPLAGGILASCLTTWVTFLPCFYLIFLGAPSVEALRNQPRVRTALATISAAVVGVVLQLALWFAGQTLFASVQTWNWGFGQLTLPTLTSVRLPELTIALVAATLMWGARRGVGWTLATGAVLGIVWTMCS